MGSHDDAYSLFFGQESELVPPRMTHHTVSERQTTALQLLAQVDISEVWRHETHHAREIIQAVKPTGTLRLRLVTRSGMVPHTWVRVSLSL